MNEFTKEYGKALYMLAQEENKTKLIYGELKEAVELLNENKEYVLLLDTPAVKLEERLSLCDSAFSSFDRYVLNFLKILTEKKMVYEINKCFKEFETLYDLDNNIERVTAESAVPLTEENLLKLKETVSKKLGKEIIIKNVVDKNILGGVILKLKDREIDGSVRGRLKDLETVIKRKDDAYAN